MLHRHSAVSVPSAIALGVLVACLGGCAPAEKTAEPGSLLSALENPILKCQEAHATCLGAAKTLADAQACDKDLGTCLTAAQDQAQATAKSFQTCQSDAMKCLQTNGAAGAADCRKQYDACTSALVPAGSAGASGGAAGTGGSTGGLPGLPGLPGGGLGGGLPGIGGGSPGSGAGGGLPGLPGIGGGAGSGAGLPGFPGLPGIGGGSAGTGGSAGSSGLPDPSAQPGVQCLKDMRDCVKAGTDPSKCADDARACLQKALSGKP